MNELIDVAESFERLWANGSTPDLDDFLASAGALDTVRLSTLARIDQHERWHRGDRRSTEEYLERYPELQSDHDSAVDLIYHEYLLREKRAEQPSLDEFAQRFPQYASVLAEQVGLHRALADTSQSGNTDFPPAQTTPASHLDSPLLRNLPALFGRYRVLELLGRGAMGTVYVAEDTQLGRQVALKLPRLDRDGSPEAVDRFRREARIAATFHHPNLCPVYDFGELDGTHFLTMPRIDGEPLSARLEAGPLPETTAAEIAQKIARAMSVAHRAGVIHRDLKPANIVLRDDGEPVVMDFGLARRDLDLDARATGGGKLVGTLSYMSPEQLGSIDAEISPASDVYSLGVILYEMLTGRPPFLGSWQEVWEQIRSQQTAVPSHCVPALSPGICGVCLQALSKDPKDRFPSMDSFADALDASTERSDEDRSKPASINARPRSRRFTSVAMVAAAILVIAGWFAWQTANLRWARQQVPEIENLARARQFFEAYDLARRVRSYLPDETKLTFLLPAISNSLSVSSEPPGAQVYLRRFDPRLGEASPRRIFVDTTPLAERVIARGDYVISVEKEGYVPFRRTWSGMEIIGLEAPVDRAKPRVDVTLTPHAEAMGREEMVFVPAHRDYRLKAMRRPTDEAVNLDGFWIDKCEVTNREYKEFVNAGGYLDERFWSHPFVKDGRTLSREDAMRELRDSTGQLGPRGWSNQTFPEGKADHPVVGITWYEAAAYAAFRRKSLPTIFQWEKAARNGTNSPLGVIMPWGLHQGSTVGRANLSGNGTVPVGRLEFGMSPFGCYEMAGNVSEWCLNETSQGFIASGGSWASLSQAWGYFAIYPGFRDSPEVGFRCVLNSPDATGDQGAMWIDIADEVRHYEPAPQDEVKTWIAQHYDYEQTPLDVHVIERTDTDAWRREKVEYNGARDERALAYLYLPKHIPAPYQVIHIVPAGDVFFRHRNVPQSIEAEYGSFIRAGRAVFAVVLRGFLERDRPAVWVEPESDTIDYVDLVADDVVDLRRGLDYLLARDDVDADRIAYMSVSRGRILMSLPAIEPRYAAAIFVADGVGKWDLRGHPAVSGVNFAPLIRGPKLLVHGRYDESLPLKTGTEPLYDLLTSPKKKVIFPGGHRPDPEFLVPKVNKWLDQQLGRVESAVSGG